MSLVYGMKIRGSTLAGATAVLLALEAWRSSRIGFRRLGIPLLTGPQWEGGDTRILHLSDLHMTAGTVYKLDRISFLLATRWDFVMVSGDLIDDDSGIEPVCAFLGGLDAAYGKFAVLGNHDYTHVRGRNPLEWLKVFCYSAANGDCELVCKANDIDRLAGSLQNNGVRLLRNELAWGEVPGRGGFQVFGVDDPSTGRDSPASLYQGVRDDALRLVLTHSPTRIGALSPLEPELVMCGHTHGGQIRLPGIGAIVTHSDAGRNGCMGLVEMDGCRVHISPGVGTGRLFPLRLFCGAEVTEIVLKASRHDIQGSEC